MDITPRLRLGLGALGAAALLAGGASWATAGTAHHRAKSRTAAVRSKLSASTPRNVIFFLGDGMGTQEITQGRRP